MSDAKRESLLRVSQYNHMSQTQHVRTTPSGVHGEATSRKVWMPPLRPVRNLTVTTAAAPAPRTAAATSCASSRGRACANENQQFRDSASSAAVVEVTGNSEGIGATG